jgi:ribosome biogenesis GTPase
LIDSPGIGEFSLDPMPAGDLAALFSEIAELAPECRFADCRHLSEPDCGVLEALADGRIAPSRYASYKDIVLGRDDLPESPRRA